MSKIVYLRNACRRWGFSNSVVGLVVTQEYYFDGKEQKIRSCLMTIELFRWSSMCAFNYSAWLDSRDIDQVACRGPIPSKVLTLALLAFTLVEAVVVGPLLLIITEPFKYFSVTEERRLSISAISTILVAVIVAVSVVFVL